MDKKLFNKIRKLFNDLDQEIYDNAQGDNGQDVRDREDEYREKLDALVTAVPPKPVYSKELRAAMNCTLLPDSFYPIIKAKGELLASLKIANKKQYEWHIKEAKKWMYEDDAPGLRGESQQTVASYTYALALMAKKEKREKK